MIYDYLKRLLIVVLLALCVSIIFFTGKEAKAAMNTNNWIFPVDGVITDSFGARGGTHKGIDIGADLGTPVYSADSGKVSKSYYSKSYGNVVFVKHGNGYETVYAHLDTRLADINQIVNKGEMIGRVGNTGKSTGAHLHFEIHEGGWTLDKENAVDPFLVFGPGEIGQVVFAKETDPFQTMDVSASVNESTVETSQGSPQLENLYSQLKVLGNDHERNNEIQKEREPQPFNLSQSSKDHYVVKKGDTLYSIAKDHKLELTKLVEENGLEIENPIYPQQVLTIDLE